MSMTNPRIAAFEKSNLRQDLPQFRVGDTVAVHYKIVEGTSCVRRSSAAP